MRAVTSIDHELLTRNIVSVARIANAYKVPVVLSTVGVVNGAERTIPELTGGPGRQSQIDRTQINAWEDVEFRDAVLATMWGSNWVTPADLWFVTCRTRRRGRHD